MSVRAAPRLQTGYECTPPSLPSRQEREVQGGELWPRTEAKRCPRSQGNEIVP